MKKLSLIVAGIFMLSVYACKKDSTTDNNNGGGGTSQTCLVKTIKYDDGSMETYTFNASNKLTEKSTFDPTDSSTTVTTYTYSGNMVTVSDGSGVAQNYYLNAKGLADSVVVRMLPLVDIKMVATYNSAGQAIELNASGTLMGTEFTQSQTMEYVNGNLSKTTADDGTSTTITNYTYYLDKVNKSKMFEELSTFMNANANLTKTQVADDGTSISYVYVLDTDGKVTQSTETDETNAITETIFTWSCK